MVCSCKYERKCAYISNTYATCSRIHLVHHSQLLCLNRSLRSNIWPWRCKIKATADHHGYTFCTLYVHFVGDTFCTLKLHIVGDKRSNQDAFVTAIVGTNDTCLLCGSPVQLGIVSRWC